jgi:hypothetical protein
VLIESISETNELAPAIITIEHWANSIGKNQIGQRMLLAAALQNNTLIAVSDGSYKV